MNALLAVLSFGGGALTGLLINFFSPAFSRAMISLFSRTLGWADPNRFDLTGVWTHICEEPIPDDTENRRIVVERVTLKQVGTTVRGEGVTDVEPRTFRYTLRVNHNLVFGDYVKVVAQQGNITGAGMVQVILDEDRMHMRGRATWFDSDTKKIESSEVLWTRL